VVAKKYQALFAEIGVPSDPRQAASAPPLSAHNDAAGQQLTITTPSVLSPSIWIAAAQALPGELIELGRYLQNWSTAVQDSHGWLRVGVALLILTVLAMAMAMLWFGWQRRTTDVAGTRGRFSKALSSFGVFLCLAFATPLLTITLLEATEVRMIEISYGFIAGVIIAAFGRAVALGVFAPDAPQRRLIALDDLTARSLANHLIWGTRALGALLVVLAVHKALAALAAMTIATNMLFALVSGVLLLHLLLSHRHGGEKTLPLARWLRGLGWLVVGVIAIALVAGYPTFAAFVAARVISISALLGGLYVLLALGNALFAERLAVDTSHGQELAADFGVGTPWLGFAAILTAAAMCLGAMLAALVLYIGPW
jgi:small-conductance mechanosensitive channel